MASEQKAWFDGFNYACDIVVRHLEAAGDDVPRQCFIDVIRAMKQELVTDAGELS